MSTPVKNSLVDASPTQDVQLREAKVLGDLAVRLLDRLRGQQVRLQRRQCVGRQLAHQQLVHGALGGSETRSSCASVALPSPVWLARGVGVLAGRRVVGPDDSAPITTFVGENPEVYFEETKHHNVMLNEPHRFYKSKNEVYNILSYDLSLLTITRFGGRAW
jgi:hypothetical protein